MWAILERLLDSSMFSPHGICLLWEPELIWLHVASDAVIAAAYFSIPIARIETRWKLSQNRGKQEMERIAAELEKSDDSGARALAALTRKHYVEK